MVGADELARLLPDAYRAVRPIGRGSIWARSANQAEPLARELRSSGIAADAAHDLEAAAGVANIVSCASLATTPLLHGRWLRAGSHLDLIGSFTPATREVDDECSAGAALYVDTEEALQKSGDLLEPLSRGVFSATDVRGTLTTLARGEATGRRSDDERTVFKSVGTTLEDLESVVQDDNASMTGHDPYQKFSRSRSSTSTAVAARRGAQRIRGPGALNRAAVSHTRLRCKASTFSQDFSTRKRNSLFGCSASRIHSCVHRIPAITLRR